MSNKKKVVKRFSAVPKSAIKQAVASVKPEAVRVEIPATAVAVAEPIAEQVVEQSAQAASVDTIAAAPEQTELLTALHGADADAAREAATALGAAGQVSAVSALIEVLGNRDGFFHSVVRAAAAHSLGQLGDPRAIDALIAAMEDSMAETSAEAVRALATLGDARAVAPLIEVVRNAEGFFLPIVRRAAVIALAKLGTVEALAELREVASRDDEDAVIRQDAVDGLGSR